MKSRAWPYVIALLVGLLVLGSVAILDHLVREQTRLTDRGRVLRHVSTVRARLERGLNERLHLGLGLAAYVSTHPAIGEAEFAELAPVLLAGRTGIRAIELAKGTVVSHIYPLAGNQAALGTRLLDLPEARAAVQRALDIRSTVVAGPLTLVQGGVAFVSRTPIYVTSRGAAPGTGPYWGLATVLIDTETVLREAGVLDTAAGLQYSLRGAEGLGAQGAVFSGDPTTFATEPVVMDVSLPNGTWQLAANPVGGWSAVSGPVWPFRLGGAGLAVLLSALAFVWARYQERLQERDQQLQAFLEVSQRLTTGLDLTTVLSAIAEAAGAVFRGEAAFRLVEGEDLVRIGATSGARARMLKERLRIGESLSGLVAATGRPLIVTDLAAEPRLIAEHRASILPDGVTGMCVPLRDGVSILGTLAIYRERGGRFSQEDLALAGRLADQATIAIKNARLYAEAEEAVRQQQRFLRQVIDVNANLIFVKDRDGRFTLVNRALADIYGTTVDELVGKTDADFNPHGDEVDLFRRTDLEVMDTLQERFIAEERVTDPRGRIHWMQTVKRPIVGPDGRAHQVLGSATDITERKRMEDALHASEQTLRELVDILPVAVWVCDAAGVVERYNRRAAELWAREPRPDDPADRFGASHRIYTADGTYLPHEAAPMAEVLRTGLPVSNQEIVIERLDGSQRAAMVNIVPLHDERGRVTGAIGCMNDITDRKRTEAEMQQQRQMLAHLTRVATLGGLSGALAHELTQPLTSILSNAQAALRLLATRPLDLAEVQEALSDIVDDDRRAGEVIRRLRTLLHKGETQLQSLDVNEVTNDVLRLAHSELLALGVTVAARLTPGLPAVQADRVALQQVLLNLIVNACDAMRLDERAERQLTVSTALDDADTVLVAVADLGTGIAAERLDQVFEPFFSTKEHGLGLGLVICRSIVVAHGGRLWATNNADRGATFRFTLPAQRSLSVPAANPTDRADRA